MAEDLYSIVHSEKYKTDALYRTMVNEAIADRFNYDGLTEYYGYMYGEPFKSSNERDELYIHHVKRGDLSKDGDAIFYVWGWPGPDYNKDEFRDYGITWAFTKEEVKELSIDEWKAYYMETRGYKWEH